MEVFLMSKWEKLVSLEDSRKKWYNVNELIKVGPRETIDQFYDYSS